MRKEDQVITLEQAKRLKELGIEQTSLLFMHINQGNRVLYIRHASHCWQSIYADFRECDVALVDYMVSAFTVAELGVMARSETFTVRRGTELSGFANWEWEDEGDHLAFGMYATEAEARAAMLIHLLEKNITTASEVNERLIK